MNRDPIPLDLSADDTRVSNVEKRLQAEQAATGIQDMRRTARAGRSQQIGFKVHTLKRQQLQTTALEHSLQQVEVVELGIDLAEVVLRRKPLLDRIASDRGCSLADIISMAIDGLIAESTATRPPQGGGGVS